MSLYRVLSSMYIHEYGRLKPGDEINVPGFFEPVVEELVCRGLMEKVEDEPASEPEPADPAVDEKMGPRGTTRGRSRK